MKILIDTSVWVECLEDDDLMNRVQQIAQGHEVLFSDTVELELARILNFMEQQDPHEAGRLKAFYSSIQKTQSTKNVESASELANDYLSKGIKIGIPVRGMKADLSIVAEASLKQVDVIISLNRKSMASDYAKLIYLLVNKAKQLDVPTLLADKAAIRKFASA